MIFNLKLIDIAIVKTAKNRAKVRKPIVSLATTGHHILTKLCNLFLLAQACVQTLTLMMKVVCSVHRQTDA